jgi:hypothetical protein
VGKYEESRSRSTRSAKWAERMQGVEEFVADTGRLPKDKRDLNLSTSERSLARFLRYQRHIEPKLDESQRERLERLPGFDWDPRESAWDAKSELCLDFVLRTGRLPRQRSGDAGERVIADWLTRQLSLLRSARLPYHRRAMIERIRRSR